jgi:immune inhibitor A
MNISRIVTAVGFVFISALVMGQLYAMPLSPEVVERLRSEGKLDEERAVMEDAFTRGVNNPVFGVAPAILKSGGGESPMVMTDGRAIVLIVDFDDNLADDVNYPTSHYEDLLFSIGTYPTGSMRDYYLENSYGNFDVTGEASGWHRMPQDYSYYVDGQRGFGSYPRNAQRLAMDAIYAADPYVDFSQYDNDGPDGVPNSADDDGYVDALFVVHAGPGYENTGNVNDIHSHAWVTNGPVSVDGVLAYRYSMEPENGKVGVFCHEFGHVLGLPDLYDYGYDARGVGYWSLMAGGSWGGGGATPVHLDGWSKIELGFVTPIVPSTNLIDIPVLNVEENPEIYKIWTDGLPDRQYFIMEHRRKIGFDLSVPGRGMVIYHVDTKAGSNDNQMCGSGSPHYLVAVEQADGECDLENNTNSGDVGDPWPGRNGMNNPNTAFNLLSTPNTDKYNSEATGVSIYNIHLADGIGYVSIAVSEVSPHVEVGFPNGGEYFEGGSQDTITWLAIDDLAVDSIGIYLSTDGGTTFPHLIASGEPNDSSFVWDIAGVNSANCRIKVVAYDNRGNVSEDISDGDFEIADISGIAGGTFTQFGIIGVSPNPTVGSAHITFAAPAAGASVKVYDVAGRLVKNLRVSRVSGAPNVLEAHWDGRSATGRAASPGIYFVRVAQGTNSKTTRVTVAR